MASILGKGKALVSIFLHYKDSVTLFLHLLPTLLGRSDWEIQTILLLGYKQRLSPEKDPLLILCSGVWGT